MSYRSVRKRRDVAKRFLGSLRVRSFDIRPGHQWRTSCARDGAHSSIVTSAFSYTASANAKEECEVAKDDVVSFPQYEPPSRPGEAIADRAATERSMRRDVPHDSSSNGVPIRPSPRPLFARDDGGYATKSENKKTARIVSPDLRAKRMHVTRTQKVSSPMLPADHAKYRCSQPYISLGDL